MYIESEDKLQEPRRPVVIALKVLVTVILISWVLSQVDLDSLTSSISNTNLFYYSLAIASHAIAFIIFSIRWWYLYKTGDSSSKYRDTFKSYYLGLFFNNFLPTGIGGDVVRILRLRKLGYNTHILVSSSLMDRMLGLTSILMMGLVALSITPTFAISTNTKLFISAIAIMAPFGLLFLFSDYMPRLTNYLSQKFHKGKFTDFILTVVSTLHEYRHSRPRILIALIFSIVAQYFIIISYILVGMSLDIDLSIAIYFIIIPTVFLATSLPISVGGLGVREGVIVSLFTLFNVDTQAAIALSFLYFFIILLISLPGGLVLLSNKK
ncbi:lysylphosphatidylglycerol synthase transmembrane domain-containing protein [Kaarinaea lacus]